MSCIRHVKSQLVLYFEVLLCRVVLCLVLYRLGSGRVMSDHGLPCLFVCHILPGPVCHFPLCFLFVMSVHGCHGLACQVMIGLSGPDWLATALPCLAMSCHVWSMSCHAMACHALSCQSVSAVSWLRGRYTPDVLTSVSFLLGPTELFTQPSTLKYGDF